jgi:hypothetical protein
MLVTSGSTALDYTVFTLKNPSRAASFGKYYLEKNKPSVGTSIYIA